MNPTRLSAQDASFIFGEDQRIPLHVGALGVIEAGPLRDEDGAVDIERIRREISNRLHLMPIFRQKLAEVPFDQGNPVWVDDPHFRVANHVQVCAVPRPGGRRELLDLMGRFQQTLLDRNRPLWEIHFVDGLANPDEIGLVYKIHHSMIDGTAGMGLATLLYDFTRERPPMDTPAWLPHPPPSASELVASAIGERISGAIDAARSVAGALLNPSRPAGQLVRLARALETMASEVEALPFNQPVGSRRAFATAQLPLEEVLATRRAYGVTLNDIVLATVTGALRRYCQERGLDPSRLKNVRAVIPVDNRGAGDVSMGSNVSSMLLDLPIDEPDLHRRVVRIYQRSQRLKEMDVAEGVNVWTQLNSVIPTTLLRATSWMQFRGLLSRANLLISNVRGPARPLFSMGAELREFYPYFGVQDHLGLTVVLVSYAGRLQIGVVADPDLVPELPDFAESLSKSFAELAHRVA
jgi:WS/DGAT/MGAT family acyltransferase